MRQTAMRAGTLAMNASQEVKRARVFAQTRPPHVSRAAPCGPRRDGGRGAGSGAMPGTFLHALEPSETAELEASGTRRRFGAGVTLLHEGDDAGTVIVLLAGRVK